MTWCVIDLETENHEYYGSLASPHCPSNYIVASGWCIDSKPVQYEYYRTPDEASKSDWLERALKDQTVLVAHNATFELHWLLHYYRDTMLAFLARGGRVFCTQYAEFLLSHQTDMYPKLEDCALKYGGTRKVDAVKLLWEQGYKTSQIDEALIIEYLADENCGDVANTRRVLYSQVKLLQEQGMYEMFKLRMDSLVFNALATYNGLYVDSEVASANQAIQEEAIAELKGRICESLPKDIPPELEFSFTSGYHMSAFLFGGSVQYRKKVSYEPKKFVKVEAYEVSYLSNAPSTYHVLHADVNLTIDFLEGYTGGVVTKFKSGRSKGLPKVLKIDSDTELLKWGDAEYRFDGIIDLESLPQIVRDQFLGKNASFRGKRDLVDGTPVYSTGKDALDVLAAFTATAKPLKELAALEKDTGTYYMRTDTSGKRSGMLQFVEPNGIIHHQLNNCSTVTGRLSGSRPNLQNIPRDGTSRVKEMFSSRFGKEGRIVEVDYSALEVVALAAISGDKNLLQQLIDGTDMHCYRLAGMLNEDYDSVYKKCHDKAHPEHKRYKQLRTDVKPRAFANQYGASAEGIAFATGCSVQEATEFKETELKLFPDASAYSSRVVRPMVESTGASTMEREQLPDGRWKLYHRGYFQAKGGTCYSFRQREQWNKAVRGYVYDYKDTELANYWCQGEGSFIVQASCGFVIRELINRNFAGGRVLPVNTVHDAIYLDCATEALATEYGLLVQSIMESTPKRMAELIPAYKDWDYHTVPFPAAPEMGINMMHKTDI